MHTYKAPGFVSGKILLPREGTDMQKWAVVACDQFTSQPDYWLEAEKIANGAPSALNITLPEIFLSQSAKKVPAINAKMREYIETGVLRAAVDDGFVYIERETSQGTREGLLGLIDLDCYDYAPGARLMVRPTEGTVPERVPPRADIRRGADIEIPHVMMLIDDPDAVVIEPLRARKPTMRALYDFDLMQSGGHIAGYAVEGEDARRVVDALADLSGKSDPLYCVGDGNHSLAAAKMCWNEIKQTVPEAERAEHPARYAMVELVNIRCPALVFEPIYRYVKGANPESVFAAYKKFLLLRGITARAGDDMRLLSASGEQALGFDAHPLADLQTFLSGYESVNMGVSVDYIHGEDALRELVKQGGAGFMTRVIDKSELFKYIRDRGVLPRKAFSMGAARDKRYYVESRQIK